VFGFDAWAGADYSDMDYNDVVVQVKSNCSLDGEDLPCYDTCRYPSQVRPSHLIFVVFVVVFSV
jgi:hypothetical protein